MLLQSRLALLTVVLLVACTTLVLVYTMLNSILVPYTLLSTSGLHHFHQVSHLKDDTQDTRGGFVLAASYFDQMTSATKRLFKLHGWAAKFNISVVEPFIIRSSFLGLNEEAVNLFSKKKGHNRNIARFSDVVNLNDWNAYIKLKHSSNARMVLWEYFLNHAPRNIIYIMRRTLKQPSAKLHFQKCPDKISDLDFLSIYNFTVINAWCVHLPINIRVSMDMFTSSILQDHLVSDVTIVFEQWKGNAFFPTNTTSLATYKIVGISQREMAKSVSYSPGIMKSVKKYIRNYMGNQRYVAVMVRTQRAIMQTGNLGLTMNASEVISHCTQRTIEKWNEIRQREKINVTFLAMDVGEFGSIHNSKKFLQQHGMDVPIDNLVTTLLGNDTTLESWEQSFVDVSPVLTPGIIAMVQKVLAAQSTCLIIAGGGSYQKSTEGLYKENHLHDQHLCSEKILKCAV